MCGWVALHPPAETAQAGANAGRARGARGRAAAPVPAPRSFYRTYGKPVSRIINRGSCYFWADERDKAQEKGEEVVGRRLQMYLAEVKDVRIGRVRSSKVVPCSVKPCSVVPCR